MSNQMPSESVQRLSELTEQAIELTGGQRPLARASGISQGTISKWLTGQNTEWPMVNHLMAFADLMDMEIGELIRYLDKGGEPPEQSSVDDIVQAISAHASFTNAEHVRINTALCQVPLEGVKHNVL